MCYILLLALLSFTDKLILVDIQIYKDKYLVLELVEFSLDQNVKQRGNNI